MKEAPTLDDYIEQILKPMVAKFKKERQVQEMTMAEYATILIKKLGWTVAQADLFVRGLEALELIKFKAIEDKGLSIEFSATEAVKLIDRLKRCGYEIVPIE